MTTVTLSQDHLDQIIERVVETVHPLRIILFGSAARGEVGPDSDVDLLVVMPEGTHRRHTAQYLHRNFQGLPLPVDVIVATPSDLAKHADHPGLIYRTVLSEGREVYAA